MSNRASTSKQNVFEDDEIFEDSSIMANFNNSSFREATARISESNMNDSINANGLNVSALCCDEELKGYDKLTGQTWIYPTNYPVRDYQFNIIKAALLKNTLVSLPTGLGKTFIAAVIMYNFYRWYPLGKIVFTAPTRPLVAQQIEACYNIIAIPPNDTIEMTGHMQVTTRKTHWQNKRVFFATPQVIYNDIKSGICPADKIKCLVIDEAHRARGNYAYCQIVSTLSDMGHKIYRILALSATPGSKVDDVVNVVKNLHIAHLELRTESCIDVAPYSHARKINTVIVQLGPELTQLRQQYVEILDGYARRLKQLNILPHNLGNLSKGRIVMLYKEFQSKERGARHPQHNYIMKDFMVLIALYHGLELLLKHGSRVFLNFFDEHPEKSWIQADDNLTALLERLRDDLGINPLSLDRSMLPDGTIPEIPKNISFGHPKFYKLKEIMLEHFHKAKENGQDTRAIVFCEYRESVNLVHCLLLQCRPLISPQMFVGQGASGKDGKTVVSQKQQLRVMRNFREGACNVLVATCVAEEGLDVGSVDLILCFDISTRSPIRLVQRCGRTGRERGGQVFILVTEGREHQTLQECMRQRDGLNTKILHSREVQAGLFDSNPRMLPRDVTPQCQKMYITVKKTDAKDKGRDRDKGKKNQKDLRTMLLGRASSSSSNTSNSVDASNLISQEEFREIYPEGFGNTTIFEEPKEYWSMSKETVKVIGKEENKSKLKLHTWLEWQRTLQKTVNVEHSQDTEILASLLQYSDAKRFELPASTQNPTFHTQVVLSQKVISSSPVKVLTPTKTKQPKKKQKFPIIKSPGKRDGDIRSLFSTATKSTKSYTKLINDLGIQNDGSIPTKLINLLVDLNLNNTNASKICYICGSICECSLLKNMRTHKRKPLLITTFLSEPKLPEIDLIDEINAELILIYAKTSKESILIGSPNHNVEKVSLEDTSNNNCSKNFELEFDFDLTSPDNIESKDVPSDTYKNFDIGDIEDIFADSSPEEAIVKDVEVKGKNSSDPKQALGFFGLDSIDDIFADSDDSGGKQSPKTPTKHENDDDIIVESSANFNPKPLYENRSPSILSGRVTSKINTSPILCSQVRKFKLSTKKTQPQSSTPASNVRRTLIPELINNITPIEKEKKPSTIQSSLSETTNKSMFTITQLVDMINKTGNEKSNSNTSKNVKQESSLNNRCTSPILLTQADRKKSMNMSIPNKIKIPNSQVRKSESLIILESDSDSENETQSYDLTEKDCGNRSETKVLADSSGTTRKPEIKVDDTALINKNNKTASQLSTKRKLESDGDVTVASPYFNKKPKLDDEDSKPLTLQEKVLAALSSKTTINRFNNDTNVNYILSPTKFPSQKENKSPPFAIKGPKTDNSDDEKDYVRKSKIEMLQIFRRDSKIDSPKSKFNYLLNSQTALQKTQKRKITFDDSDDDFVATNDYRNRRTANSYDSKSITNHKVRKKKRKGNGFLDLEAELSDDGCDSGDELSDDSTGSIADFICDENITHHEDMQALYMRSIKSPVKGVFKIPQLPKRFDKEEIFSQYVEEDTYEMDSFCVDSHIGLTQANDVSELELAEMILDQRKSKKKARSAPDSPQNDDSPLVTRKKKNVRRRIHSDSDDSS